jgi:putative intracellular protease/amidase
MKKTAVLIYNGFCNFEISVCLEILAMAGKQIMVFSKELNPVTSEEGVKVVPDQCIHELTIEEYDSLILPGAMDIREAIADESILMFIREFAARGMVIGAISIAPILLLKAGVLGKKPFMAGVNRAELFEEGFTENDLSHMIDWDDNLKKPVQDGYMFS